MELKIYKTCIRGFNPEDSYSRFTLTLDDVYIKAIIGKPNYTDEEEKELIDFCKSKLNNTEQVKRQLDFGKLSIYSKNFNRDLTNAIYSEKDTKFLKELQSKIKKLEIESDFTQGEDTNADL